MALRLSRFVFGSLLIVCWGICSAQTAVFGGNAQHTGQFPVAAHTLNRIKWQVQIDKRGTGALAHFAQPLVTDGNTVITSILPTPNTFTLNGYSGSTGAFKYSLSVLYAMPNYTWVPTYQAAIANGPNGKRLYFPGPGGTLYFVENIDGPPTSQTQLCFYGLSTYNANKTAFNKSVYINTPITADSHGNIFFGFRVGRQVSTYLLSDANSDTLFVNSTAGMLVGDIVHFNTANTNRTIVAIPDSTHIRLDSSVNATELDLIIANTTPPSPFTLDPTTGCPAGGWARIAPDGTATYVLAPALVPSSTIAMRDSHNFAPALSNDETTIYAVVKSAYNFETWLVSMDSTTLALRNSVHLVDPRGLGIVGCSDNSTATPLVAPDGDVYLGVTTFPSNGSRGFLMHFSGDLQTQKTTGGFGWDYTPAIVPANKVPSYHGRSAYLLAGKNNNYLSAGDGGSGINTLAVFDPNDETQTEFHPSSAGMTVMREVMSVIAPTPDPEEIGSRNTTREWCVNAIAVDPRGSVYADCEDGRAYRWDLGTNSLAETVKLTDGIGEPYVPTTIGPDGTVYTLNGTYLFALGTDPGISVSLDSSLPDNRTVVVGTPITFTATVTGSGLGLKNVTFTDRYFDGIAEQTNTLGHAILLNGKASLTTHSLVANQSGTNDLRGCHFITASYTNNAGLTTSVTRVQKVHANASSSFLFASGLPQNFGADVPVSIFVNSVPLGVFNPKMQVAVVDTNHGNRVVGQGAVNYSSTLGLDLLIHNLEPGTHQLAAEYYGDTQFAKSTSAPIPVVVRGLVGISSSPAKVKAGSTATGQVQLAAPAQSGGETVTLSTDSAYVSVPASVVVPYGQSQAPFTITTTAGITSMTQVTITGTYGATKTRKFWLRP